LSSQTSRKAFEQHGGERTSAQTENGSNTYLRRERGERDLGEAQEQAVGKNLKKKKEKKRLAAIRRFWGGVKITTE